MKKQISLWAAIMTLGIFITAAPAYSQCVMLTWKGGAAKTVKATISQRGKIVTINYNWKNGTMSGRVQSDGSLKGTWIQDGSNGGKFQFKVPRSGSAKGWWSSNSDGNRKKYPMTVKRCR